MGQYAGTLLPVVKLCLLSLKITQKMTNVVFNYKRVSLTQVYLECARINFIKRSKNVPLSLQKQPGMEDICSPVNLWAPCSKYTPCFFSSPKWATQWLHSSLHDIVASVDRHTAAAFHSTLVTAPLIKALYKQVETSLWSFSCCQTSWGGNN